MSINNLHMHMYISGKLTLTQLMTLYPAENAISIAARTVTHTSAHG